ncbi:MAG: excisionase family DNA-binding protein [Rhodocyclaceae bacterium]|nr:excisionase family DNA-binding protein [Rhodocyclaceae bacterium]
MPRPTDLTSYCSTSVAAKRLGLSPGTVQQMVENGTLEAWKTAGGHRRILTASVEAFLARSGGGTPQTEPHEKLRVLVAEDDEIMRKLYAHNFEAWRLPLDVKMVSNGVDAVLELGRNPPDVLIADLVMPLVDGFEMLRRVAGNPLLEETDLVVVSGMPDDEIEERGGLPEGVTRYGKPVPFSELRGYLQAKVVALHRLMRRRRRSAEEAGG